MKSYPFPAMVAALAAVLALPFSAAAAFTLLLTCALGFIIHADYILRARRVRLPRRSRVEVPAHAQRFSAARERHRLAA